VKWSSVRHLMVVPGSTIEANEFSGSTVTKVTGSQGDVRA